jgi:hypothetical protein
VEAMDWINFVQLDIDKSRTNSQEKAFKQHLQYLKEQNKKTHKMHKSMVSVLSNFNMAICHAFIKDQNLVSPLTQLSESNEDEQPV